MIFLDNILKYWKLLAFVVFVIGSGTMLVSTVQANEAKLSSHDKELEAFKEWIAEQEALRQSYDQRFNAIQEQLKSDSARQNMMLEKLLNQRGQ